MSTSMYESTAKRLLTSQAYMIAYSVLLALLGKARYALLLVFLFWILMFVVQSRLGKGPLGHGRVRPEDVLEGRKLYEEKNVREIQMRDEMLLKEIQEQSKISMYLSLAMLVGLVYFMVAWKQVPAIDHYIAGYIGEGRLSLFLAYLAYFEGYFVIYQGLTSYALRKVKIITTINTPLSYVVTDKGIVTKGIFGRTAIKFPLPPDVQVRVDEKRSFVELVKRGKRTVLKIRFYARNARRLGDIIRRKGLARAEEGPEARAS
ncbi:MAG: DUF2208 domain-containing protein [Desulfurococcales archaeon]|nr:DUF2208 domain-containing protein [Desulfurococcales archaeon]